LNNTFSETPHVSVSRWCGLALLAMLFIKGNLEPIFTSFVENIFFSILAMITIAWRLNGGGESGRCDAWLPGRKQNQS